MKVTNNLNLPQAFVNAVSVERHNQPGCYSATTLNKGVKEIVLQERHWNDFTVDAADNIWAVFGSAVHSIFEKENDGNFHEEYFDLAFSNSRVTGCVDSYDMKRGVIFDWKTASVYKVMKHDFADWYRQGMTYAWLLTKSGFEVHRVVFVALLKDHSKTKAKTESGYPQQPTYVYQFDVTPEELEQTGKRIEEKILALEAAAKLSDDEIPPCTDEERWADGERWAVMKNGRKTAVRVFDNSADADAMAGELGNAHYVEHRPAVSRKCADYCLCKDYCSFYKSMNKDGK